MKCSITKKRTLVKTSCLNPFNLLHLLMYVFGGWALTRSSIANFYVAEVDWAPNCPASSFQALEYRCDLHLPQRALTQALCWDALMLLSCLQIKNYLYAKVAYFEVTYFSAIVQNLSSILKGASYNSVHAWFLGLDLVFRWFSGRFSEDSPRRDW